MLILKIGGNEIDNPDFIKQLGRAVVELADAPVIVHGGGKEIKALQARLGVEAQYIDGLRVTDEESLSLVQMVLAGRVNKRLVAALSEAGLDAFGMSGVDRASVKATKLHHPQGDLGFVGEVVEVRAEVFEHLLDHNVVPILSPICYGPGGNIFNVNADHVAVSVAVALQADELVFISNVPGVLKDETVIPQITPSSAEQLITGGIIKAGMLPKIHSALKAATHGVSRVRITNLDGLKTGGGTVITNGEYANVRMANMRMMKNEQGDGETGRRGDRANNPKPET